MSMAMEKCGRVSGGEGKGMARLYQILMVSSKRNKRDLVWKRISRGRKRKMKGEVVDVEKVW